MQQIFIKQDEQTIELVDWEWVCAHTDQHVDKDDWGQLWYVCSHCDETLDGEPAQDREEALADMRGDE